MKGFIPLLFLLISVHSLTIIDSILATKCVYYMKQFDWGCGSTSNSAKYYSCRCHNVDWIGSITNCLESEGANDTSEYIDHAYRHIRGRCLGKGHIDWPVDVLKSYQQNATSYLQEPTFADKKITLSHPISVNSTGFEYTDRTFNHIYAQVIRSQAFSWGYIFFITFFISLATAFNFFRIFIIRYTNGKHINNPTSLMTKIRCHIVNSNLRHDSIITLFKGFRFQIPTRLDTLVIAFFGIYMVLATCAGISIELPNQYQNGHMWQLWDLLGYRTALGAFALIPPTFFFGIRNNPFINLTGSSISSFMFYHKWLAFGMSLQALIHSGVWTAYTIREGDYSSWAADAYWIWGVVGTTLCFLIIFSSMMWFRDLCYEFFLIIHKSFSIVFITAMWYHCNTLGWMGWIYSTIVIYVYDSVVRFIWILANGGAKPAKITKLNDELIRVLVECPNKSNDYWYAGAFAYIYFLNIRTRFYQSHPFSIMKSKRSRERNCYAFVFKTHKGITNKIMNELNRNFKVTGDRSKYINVFVEGPYGPYKPLVAHEQYVFIAGGVGFTPVYSQAVDIIERNNKNLKSHKKLIKFIWIVKNSEYYKFFKEDLHYLFENDVEIEIHITRNASNNIDDKTEEQEGNIVNNFSISSEENIELLQYKTSSDYYHKAIEHTSRPLISDIVQNVDVSQHSTMFIASGPSTLNDDVRAAVNHLTKGSRIRIDYQEDSFIF
ncbi:hypothetical protein WICMUC_000950 [Wickerhamomyces mucosus]|uniref:FAD-binding FR-type domain-containing protein n=1 Tax=Wickerhamomyces mucosus TaxID=1378264 RepID=A0A9P8TI37_9ASCO|nr:hypothetical protein WICMUC_000950 [Wickerhamomyces mucosus]